jgi:putative copper resistance protein D
LDNDALITVLFVATRAVHIGACLLLFGVLAFDRFIARPITLDHHFFATEWNRSVRSLVASASSAALLSGAAWLALNAITMSGLPPGEALRADVLRVVLTETHFGKLWEIRALLWLATTLVVTATVFFDPPSSLRVGLNWLALILSGLVAGSLAWAGHGLTGEPSTLHLWADVVHILICGLWPVGLLPLAMLLFKLRRWTEPAKWVIVSQLVRRFSAMSLASVALLALSGLVNSWILVGSVSNLFSTLYGKVLLAKIALFCGMVMLGAINLLRLKPHLAIDLTDGIAAEGEAAARRLQKNVAIEAALAAGVFILVGLLGLLPPAMEAMMHEHHHH